jgi:hypothetical protein
VLACSGARLDPEKNQALTFDTTESSDAGVAPLAPALVKRTAPSQPGSAAQRELEPAAASSGSPALANAPAPEPIRCTQDPPDPKPLSTRDWVALQFTYADGKATPRASERLQTPKPRDSARIVGRYAVELWIGCELIDRVRFNFPLQAADPPANGGTRRGLHEPLSLTARGHLSATVLVPFSERATRAELVDRSAGTRVALAWPPNLSSAVPKKAPTKPAAP